jgi:hypothetical protein
MVPIPLHVLAILALAAGGLSALAVAADEVRHPQRMWIMAAVWPLTALFGSAVAYVRWGRPRQQAEGKPPFAVSVAKGALHCGAGCTLGDVVAETLLALLPALATVFGFGWLFSQRIFAGWVLDFILAFGFGIVFQFFAIAPMRGLGLRAGLLAALKADTLSLIAWQVGMYGFMAIAQFGLFGALLGVQLSPAMPEFWFMMQLAMVCGFATSYPVNWWLIRAGLKEAM